MRELLETYDAWRSEDLGVGRAVVVRTFGSAPRAEGAVLLVAEDGRMIGSVSGGCVEAAAAEEVLRARATGHARVIRYGISDEQAWDVGLACGGTIDVLVEPDVAPGVVAAARAASAVAATILPAPVPPAELGPFAAGDGEPPRPPIILVADAGPAREAARLAGDRAGVPPAVAAAARDALASGRSSLLAAERRTWFVEAFAVPPRLVVVGATEVARHLVGFARSVGYGTVVVDPRAAFATPARFPDVDRLLVAWPDEAFDRLALGPDDAVAVLSHDPKIDEPAILEACRRGARYVGAVGSRRSQAARRERLLAAGLRAEELDRLRGPIGLDLGGREPAETALAIVAELVAARRGGTGAPLRDGRGRITPDRG
ncbi:MAG: XdhC family protein [Chloroflexi bacterium]|nr:XdhC family protein [Chloroflexota bacterium]